jgi:hypothetical protein
LEIDLDDERYSTTFSLQERSMMRLYDYCEFVGMPQYALDGIIKILIQEKTRDLILIRLLAGKPF